MSVLKNLSYFFLPLPLASAAIADEKAIRIGYAQCAAPSRNSIAGSAGAAKLRWYFAHASVGANMVDGLADLKKADKLAYPYATVFSDKTPPQDVLPGTVYEHNRGNPGWKAKFDQFESCVSNGWHFPKVDIVMNKLCYIDQLASSKYYIRSMTNLEAAFPETVFVYMTMPLTTASDWENGLRNGFNERVRDWTRQTGRVLFDLADIEAHDSKGELCSFSHRNKTRAKLAESYSNDGGHLNETGRQLVAQGFYALALALQEKKRALVNAAK